MKRLFCTTLLLLTAACQPVPDAPRYAMPRFDDQPKIPIQAAQITIERQYIPSGRYPQVEHEFPVRIDDAAEQWLRDRIALVADAGTVTFVIEDSRVTAQQLPRTKGIKGAFTKDQDERYDARLLVRGTLEKPNAAIRSASAVAEVKLSRSIQENATIRERDELYYVMMKDILAQFGQTMENQLHAQMVPYDSVDSFR